MRATPTHGRQVWPHPARPVRTARAKVAELADALDLESSGETRESSSLSFRTSSPQALLKRSRARGSRPRSRGLFDESFYVLQVRSVAAYGSIGCGHHRG